MSSSSDTCTTASSRAENTRHRLDTTAAAKRTSHPLQVIDTHLITRELTLVAVAGLKYGADALDLARAGLAAGEHGRVRGLHRDRAGAGVLVHQVL